MQRFASQWLSGGRSGGAAEGFGEQPADPEDLPLPQPADRPLPLAGQLLLPSSAGCNLQVGQRGRADVTFCSRSSYSSVMTRCRVSSPPQECHRPGWPRGDLGPGSRLQRHNLTAGRAFTPLVIDANRYSVCSTVRLRW